MQLQVHDTITNVTTSAHSTYTFEFLQLIPGVSMSEPVSPDRPFDANLNSNIIRKRNLVVVRRVRVDLDGGSCEVERHAMFTVQARSDDSADLARSAYILADGDGLVVTTLIPFPRCIW
ncbi:hypothetical protein CC1G_14201 [Coprinopsis cinerea okayama7|uniref:Uncharacterized protein n=1 Tax=Coprinopsis cinerea (strain Okayama-7 / 130 / ATCC MYA-4618 / FGSC 9003) TaxID=240176 RepID=D6RLN0_COPC7|nr:hypothetical protein CC1G_14201 [Coprinopsis cinerea okayama7\|eukprot:XP_002911668.1 hypothetical protein CC1G_14201 [Coprinopsis cinerea okayama7\